MGDDTQCVNSLSLLGLSLTDASEGLRDSTGSDFILKEWQELCPQSVNDNSYTAKLRHPVSSNRKYPSTTGFQHSFTEPRNKKIVNNDEFLASIRKGPPNGENLRRSFLADMPNEQLLMDSTEAKSLDFLASQFPGLTAESLAELQVDGGLMQDQNSKALPVSSLAAFDLPAISLTDGKNSLPRKDPLVQVQFFHSLWRRCRFCFSSQENDILRFSHLEV